MPKAPPPNFLTLDLKGELPMDKFEKAIAAFFDLVKAVTTEALNENQHIRWTIAVRAGSAIVNAIPHYDPDIAEQAQEVLRAVPSGIRALERGAEEMPKYFTAEAVKAVRKLGTVRSISGEDVTQVGIRRGPDRSVVTTKSVAAADSLVGGQRQSYGSIEGKMRTITDLGGFKFVIYDSLFQRRVDCFIGEELMEKAIASFRQRVRVSGQVQSNRLGDPVSIKAVDIYVFRPNSELPSVHEMRGILREG
jgi:hypothetical protein